MKILAELTEKSLGLSNQGAIHQDYRLRRNARAIIINSDGNMALQHYTKKGFYCIPGGGLDPDETVMQGLHREVKEEVGCDIIITDELGMVIEYRNTINRLFIGYGFAAKIQGDFYPTKLDEKEIEYGMKTIWVSPQKALELLTQTSNDIQQIFTHAREKIFVNTYIQTINNK